MINNQHNDLNQWDKLLNKNHSQRMVNNLSANLSNNLTTNLTAASKTPSTPQNITLQVNGEEEEKFLINKTDNSLKINHDNGLSQSCLSLNDFNIPSSQLSLDSLNSDTCIHAEAGRLFHQQLDKELSKVIPSAQRRKTSVETVQNRYKFNKKRKKNLGMYLGKV